MYYVMRASAPSLHRDSLIRTGRDRISAFHAGQNGYLRKQIIQLSANNTATEWPVFVVLFLSVLLSA